MGFRAGRIAVGFQISSDVLLWMCEVLRNTTDLVCCLNVVVIDRALVVVSLKIEGKERGLLIRMCKKKKKISLSMTIEQRFLRSCSAHKTSHSQCGRSTVTWSLFTPGKITEPICRILQVCVCVGGRERAKLLVWKEAAQPASASVFCMCLCVGSLWLRA